MKIKSDNIRIILVTPSLEHGGGERKITELANFWSTLEYDVTLLYLRSGVSFYPINPKVKLIELGYSKDSGQSVFEKIQGNIRTFYRLRKHIRSINPKFVFSILSTTNLLTIFAGSFLKPKIFVNDILGPYWPRTKSHKKLRKWFYKYADGVMVMTQIAKDLTYKETKNKNIKVISNPLREVVLDKSIKKEKVILNVGSLHSAKGQHFLIEAYANLNRPDYKLVILGEGGKRKSLEALIKKLKVEENVYLPGAVKNVDEWLAKAELFAFSSISESWGSALTEAMAAGLPVISFDCEVGPREMIVDGYNGYLIPEKDVEGLTEKMRHLIENPEIGKELGQKAKEDAKKYKMETIGKEIFNFCTNNEYI